MNEPIPVFYDKENLIKHFHVHAPKKIVNRRHKHGGYDQGIAKFHFKDFGFTGNYQGFLFKGCKFTDCQFENIWGFFLYFDNCTFENCSFKNSRFSHGQFSWTMLEFNGCRFRNVEIDEGDLDNTNFNECDFIGFSLIGETVFNVQFSDCSIENSQFQSICYYGEGEGAEGEDALDVSFYECEISFSHFISSDFSNSVFANSLLYLCSFIDCMLVDDTLQGLKTSVSGNYATMDFQTILKSDLNNPVVLKEYFNIHVPDVKVRIAEIAREMTYKTVFISYSFKDQEFAKNLSEVFDKYGVKFFLWEKDAPGGEYLEDIMAKNVHSHEVLLFISSEHSLRSKACQFELSEGRKMQEVTWKNVFFPIHVDNYLFEVKKSQIRPLEMQAEYWENISELRRTNSKDFTSFSYPAVNTAQLEKDIVNHILKYLRTS